MPGASCTSGTSITSVTSLGSVLLWSLGPFVCAQGSVVAYGTTGLAGLSLGWALTWGVGIATFIAAGIGRQGVGMYGGC